MNQLSQSTWQAPPQNQMAYPGVHPMYQQQPIPAHPQQQPMQTSQQLIGAMRPMGSMSQQQPLAPAATVNNRAVAPQQPNNNEGDKKKKKNDLLDFDVFSEFHTPTLMTKTTTATTNRNKQNTTDATDGASQSVIDSMLDLSIESIEPVSTKGNTNTNSLLDISIPAPSVAQQPSPAPASQPIQQQQQSQPKAPVSPPLMNQENYTVPLDALQPGIIAFSIYILMDIIFVFALSCRNLVVEMI